VLISDTGKALFIDYGYDSNYGQGADTDRAARRPWLYSLPRLQQDHAVTSIDVAIPTHYHDDHLAGFNLLRQTEGTRVWAADTFADVLEHPLHYDLPCLWYDPIPVDRAIPVGEPFRWEEYELSMHDLPGHTLYAVAIRVDVDGKRIVAMGDQMGDVAWLYQAFQRDVPINEMVVGPLPPPRQMNYVYKNRFRIGDYPAGAELLMRLKPDILVYGHWGPGEVDGAYLESMRDRGEELDRLHRELLPLEEVDFGAEGSGAWIRPYRSDIESGAEVALAVEVLNPLHREAEASVRLVAPAGWAVRPSELMVRLPAGASSTLEFCVTPPAGVRVRRARVAADLTVEGRRFGQQAEALITVR
jgi:hypothetical protein